MSSEMDCIVQDFLVESYENLDQLDQALVALEADSYPQERLGSIFRAVHTIKGTCGFFGFSQLEQLTHAGENLLCRLRDGLLTPTPVITNALLEMLDSIREILASIAATGCEGSVAHQQLMDKLNRLQFSHGEQPAVADEKNSDAVTCGLTTGTTPSENAFSGPQTGKVAELSPAPGSAADTAVRVDVRLLDKLMVLVGELVLARNRMQQHASCLGNSQLVTSSQRLNLITTELQEAVMKTRMQPIGSVWSKFPRLVRDLAVACGKQVSLEMEGLETELDKTLIEAIKDPFTHLLRNSIDHGIESPDVRKARGKSATGRICSRAYHEGGQVNIDVADDGDGIFAERIKSKAVERGLITLDQAQATSEHDAIRLIFLPSFSTADKVTSVSGRGVGMDVVKANIERIGGSIDVCSQPGAGTTVRIKIPLTLAIMPALLVGHGDALFAIPQGNLLELVRLETRDAKRGIELVHGAPVYRLRGKLLPLLYLNRELRLPGSTTKVPLSAGSPNSDVVNILVLQAEDRRFGLIVGDIFDSAEIVVKPLDKRLQSIRPLAGATILGDGKLALILDIVNLAKSAKLLTDQQADMLGESSLTKSRNEIVPAAVTPTSQTVQTLLVCQADNGGRIAIPLSSVTRLEEIPASQIERAGNNWFVQYRGQILPLVDIARELGGTPDVGLTAGGDRVVPVVVCAGKTKPCGLIVERILDVVEQDLTVRGKTTRRGIDYTAVVQGRVTEIVKIATMLRLIDTQREQGQAT